MSKHTPAPWKCERLTSDGKPYATLYEAHIDLGQCMIWAPPGNEEQEANARLIAAAPDLLRYAELEAEYSRLCDRRRPDYSLDNLMEWIEANEVGDQPVGQWLGAIRSAAIAKAEGSQ